MLWRGQRLWRASGCAQSPKRCYKCPRPTACRAHRNKRAAARRLFICFQFVSSKAHRCPAAWRRSHARCPVRWPQRHPSAPSARRPQPRRPAASPAATAQTPAPARPPAARTHLPITPLHAVHTCCQLRTHSCHVHACNVCHITSHQQQHASYERRFRSPHFSGNT